MEEFWIKKLNVHVMYNNQQIGQARKEIWLGKIKPQPSDDIYFPENLLDWHSQVYVIIITTD